MKYLRLFRNENDYNQYINGNTDDYITPNICVLMGNKRPHYTKYFDALSEINGMLENIISETDEPLDINILDKIQSSNQDFTDINNQLEEIILSGYEPLENPENYLTFEALSSVLIISFTNNCQYSLGTNEWFDLQRYEYTPEIKKGQKIYFKATGLNAPDRGQGIGSFGINGNCNLSGNIMSLLFGDEADSNLSLSGKNWVFDGLFSDCDTIIDASQLKLPATTLAEDCYGRMFKNCTSLVVAPELPATTLAPVCYQYMFAGCTSLTQTPTLPATTLARGCYSQMFNETNLLPDCTNIDFTNESVIASQALSGLFAGTKVTDEDLYNILPINPSTGKYWLPVTTLAERCYRYMFKGCNSLVTAPELPATTLANECYNYMFNGCTKLNYIKALFTTEPGSSYTSDWVSGVSPAGTFVKNVNATWDVNGNNGIPKGWTVENNEGGTSNLISFTIEGVSYQAEEGMTWEEWVDSEYNVDDFYLINERVCNLEGDSIMYSGAIVLKDKKIIKNAGYNYYIENGGSD